MNISKLFEVSEGVSRLPPGAVNVCLGNAVEGPGGRWIPCASAIADDTYVSCIFEVGPGRRQVCAGHGPTNCATEALTQAIDLAIIAAA